MIHFLNIVVQRKSMDDWRAFLYWSDSSTMTRYEIRGYGATPAEAADDAWNRYNEDRELYTVDEGVWE